MMNNIRKGSKKRTKIVYELYELQVRIKTKKTGFEYIKTWKQGN